jgi:magnesium-transporting ATPase (P-type)
MIILFIYYAKTYDANVAGSLMFIFLVANELLYSFSCRNLKHSVLNKSFFSNSRLSIGVGVILLIQVLILTTGLSHFFIVDGIGITNILITLGVCLLTFIVGELVKPIYAKLFKDYKEVK